MTTLQCRRCDKWWTMHTLWPGKYRAISSFCPLCIPVIYPRWENLKC